MTRPVPGSTNPEDVYVWTSLGNNWYHAELPATMLVSFISGYGSKDIPDKNLQKKSCNAIKINAGNCVIDNFRIGAGVCEIGNYNSTTYKPSVGEIYWAKTSWGGTLHNDECTITFSDDTKARHIPTDDPNLFNHSPFYFEILDSGQLTFTVTVVCGYQHESKTISKTITIQ